MSAVRAVAVVVLAIAVALVVVVSTRPDRFHVERSATIVAPSDAIFAYVNDLRRWTAWSPWEKIDPQMQRSYDGPASGVGASYHWTGNAKIGEGSATITESTPNRRVGIALEFLKPFRASNTAAFSLVPDGAGTRITWAMDGRANFVTKLVGLFMSMDAMVGTQFESGLEALKRITETAP